MGWRWGRLWEDGVGGLILECIGDVLRLGSFEVVVDVLFVVGCGGSFVGESMKDDSSLVFAYYKEGATNPTFLYFADALKEVKC